MCMAQRKRTAANIEAEKRYAPKRAKKPVNIRLDDEDMARLDKARGRQSRSAYLLAALMEKLSKASL